MTMFYSLHTSQNGPTMKPTNKNRRKNQRHTIENSVMVTNDGVFQLTDISTGGFCFKCSPHADFLEEWVTDILTPTGGLKKYFAEKKWVANYEDDDLHFPPIKKVGVEFRQLSNDQKNHLVELINSSSALPTS